MTKSSKEKRSAVRNLISSINVEKLKESNVANAPQGKQCSPAIKSMNSTLTANERQLNEVKKLLAAGKTIVELDPKSIEQPMLADRFAFEKELDFQNFVEQIRDKGQLVPILVRPHPEKRERYQVVFGNRRRIACEQLGRPVKAFVVELTNDEAFAAQVQENQQRKDISFVETLVHCLKANKDFPRAVIAKGYGVSEKTISTYLSLARTLPDEDVLQWIGPAREIGRPRWEEFIKYWKNDLVISEVRSAIKNIAQPDLDAMSSDDRFLYLLDIAVDKANRVDETKRRNKSHVVRQNYGPSSEILLKKSPSKMTVEVDLNKQPGLAAFIEKNLDRVIAEYKKEEEPLTDS